MAIESSVSSGTKHSRGVETESSGGRLVSVSGQALPLLGTRLVAEAKGGLARVTVEQRFGNPHKEPLKVSYLLPLPADGAVSGYRFTLGDRTIEGEIDRRVTARARYEQALMEGKTAALLEQARTALFTQEIGNLPPGAEVLVEVTVDQPLQWLSEGMWEWRFPTVVGPRFMGEPGRVADAAAVSVDVAKGPLRNRLEMSLRIGDAVTSGRAPESPSHSLQTFQGEAHAQVQLESRDGVALDRDVVVRWPVAKPAVGVSIALARPVRGELKGATFGLLTLVPPDVRPTIVVPRDLIFLIDVSGSMSGRPLEQVKRIIGALIDSLDAGDRLELIAFASEARRWTQEPVQATKESKKEAMRWVKALHASGSTEMVEATIEALKPLRAGAQRQVVLLTDGCIGFEEKLVRTVIDQLPRGARLHVVGVGDGVNRSVTQAASRAGGGVEVIIGVDEDVERGAARLLERTRAPLVTDLEIEGVARLAPRRLPDLFAGSPSVVAVELLEGCTALRVKGVAAGGVFEQTLAIEPLTLGSGHQAIVQRFGRELVEDLETTLSAGASSRDVDRAVERAGLDFQIATRMTSWIAITSERTVSPGPTRSQTQPHELVHGVSAEGMGLRDAMDGDLLQFEDSQSRAMAPPIGERSADRPAGAPRHASKLPLGIRRSVGGLPSASPSSRSRDESGAAPDVPRSQEELQQIYGDRMSGIRVGASSRNPWWLYVIILLAVLALPVALWFLFTHLGAQPAPVPAPQGQVQTPHGAQE